MTERSPVLVWQAPDAVDPARPWRDVATLTRPNVIVEVMTHGGRMLEARVALHGPSGRWMWFERRDDAPGGWAVLTPWRAPGNGGQRLPDRAPARWRPMCGIPWPDELPAPMPQVRRIVPAVVEPSEGEGGEPVDGWPIPGIRLGRCVPPTSRAECEARLLRAIRTMNTPGLVAMPRPDGGSIDSVAAVARRALAVEPDPEAYHDRGHIPDVQVAWEPEKRDLSDWEYAMRWTNGIDGRRRAIVFKRASAPVWSWRQIADRHRVTQARARQIFDAAIGAAFAAATRGDTA